jgi:signal peptidase I
VHIRKWFGWFILASIVAYFMYGFWASPMRPQAKAAS